MCAGLTACRKDIKTPSVETTKVFGNWKWISSQTGSGNIVQTPESAGYERELEYKENGIYKEFVDGKKEEKLLFSFIEGTTINFAEPVYIIKYIKSGLNKKEKFRDDFSIQNEDTLILKRDCAGCYFEYYIRM